MDARPEDPPGAPAEVVAAGTPAAQNAPAAENPPAAESAPAAENGPAAENAPAATPAVSPANEGGPAAADFVGCYSTHYRRLVRALRLSGADAGLAEDLAQEAFARALVRWRRVSRGSNPPGYVYTTGFRLLERDKRRSWRTVPGGAVGPAPGVSPGWSRPGQALGPAPTPSRGIGPSASPTESTATTVVAVEAVLAAMPARRRACAVMCLVVGLSVRDAAGALGIADGTVRKHLDEARRDLRPLWEA